MEPKILLDFKNPPIDQLRIGVSYASIPALRVVDIGNISNLFDEDFPKIARNNLANLPGPLSNSGFPGFGFLFNIPQLTYASSNIELSANFGKTEFSISWDKSNKNSVYPRFEKILHYFEKYFDRIQKFTLKNYKYEIEIKDYIIGYHNAVLVKDYSELQDWFEIAISKQFDFEQFNFGFSNSFSTSKNVNFAELESYITTGVSVETKQNAILFGFTFMGDLDKSDYQSVSEFLNFGRTKIAESFNSLTTKTAHEIWSN